MNRSRTTERNRMAGFSLLELVVVVAILTIVMGAAFSLMSRGQSNFDRNQTLIEARTNADFAVSRVSEIIRGAGANPENAIVFNTLNFISNKDVGSSTDDTSVVRVVSDLNGDGDTDDRVSTGASYFIITSEDVTLKFYGTETTVSSTTIPARTIALIDNTPGTDQYKPIVLAQNILSFECEVTGTDISDVEVTIEAGPSRNISPSNPRYASFTRVTQVRLRNRN